ncbi:MAG: hypothetical protein GXO75_18955 [Calditrichaeota bacterium]|nr:hypothetical protein [Calditrichota bacterium]
MFKNLPVNDPKPNAREFIDILMGRKPQTRTPLIEYIVDDVLLQPITTELLGRTWVEFANDRESQKAWLDNFIEFWLRMGYDFVRYERALDFGKKTLVAADPAPASNRNRAWADGHEGTIRTWEDFERYPWPKLEDADYFAIEYLNDHLPEGMGLITCHAAGMLEHLSQIMSYEGLCLAIYDEPELVQAMSDRLGELITGYYRNLLDLDRVVAIFQGDDMGFRTATLLAPDDLRKFVLPWHKRFAQRSHEKGLPYFLHCCGNVESIMEDLISDVGIDGKHSFEDAIIPAEISQEKYGDRIAVLGGLDINTLAKGSPQQVRERTRFLIDTCGARGRYAIGSGNSIPSYIPVENYLTMIDEALEGNS